jgi:hypothetical protein
LHKYNFGSYPLRNHASDINEYLHLAFDKEINKLETREQQYIYLSEFTMNLYQYTMSLNLQVDRINFYSYDQREEIRNIFFLYFERVIKILRELGYNLTSINDRDEEGYDETKPSYWIVKEINPLAEKVASMMDNPKIKFDILKFNHYNIEEDEQQSIIEDMYKYFEGLRSTSVNTTADALANLMNNGLRHNAKTKIKNKKIENYINEDKQKALDQAYNLLIECFYHDINLPTIKKIKSLI